MLSQRGTHYWLWFLLFGVILGMSQGFNSEAIVVAVTGLLGLLAGLHSSFSRYARFYDLVIGLVFTVLGVLGILTAFPLAQQIGIGASSMVLGLNMMIPYALIHTVLGLTSLNHGFRAVPVAPVVEVGTSRAVV